MESEPREAHEELVVTDQTATPVPEETLAAEVTEPTEPQAAPDADPAAEIAGLRQAVTERTNDLKRLQAEYVNYKRRVDRDRDVARNAGIESVIMDLMGLLDTIRIAREHEEMTGGFKLLVDELEKVTAKYGLETFGNKGEVFDPQVHEALMQAPMPGVTEPTVLDVMQAGYRFKGRVLRAARVAVGMPAEETNGDSPAGAEAGGGDSSAE